MLITSYMIDEKLTLAFIVFLLGIRHGFELDHLAVIDGMMVTDGLNGYFIARLLHQADKRSRSVSRILDLGLGVFSLFLGSFYLVSYFR